MCLCSGWANSRLTLSHLLQRPSYSLSLKMGLSSTDSTSAPHQYTFQLNPNNCTWILFFTDEIRFRRYTTWNTKRPLCCFSSQLGFLLNRIDPQAFELLSRVFQLFPSPLSLPEHTFCPQLLSLVILCRVACHSGRRCWPEKRSLEGLTAQSWVPVFRAEGRISF